MINFVTLVLDESGSMFPIKQDTIGGFNTFVKGLVDAEEAAPEIMTRFSFMRFNDSKREFAYQARAIRTCPQLTDRDYQPTSGTPLIDACCEAIAATEMLGVEHPDARVHIAIQTDGKENASREHTRAELKALIEKKREEGWLFTFLGAGEEAFAQATTLGVDPNFSLNYARGNTESAFKAATRVASEYTSTGMKNAFTVDERESSVDDKS